MVDASTTEERQALLTDVMRMNLKHQTTDEMTDEKPTDATKKAEPTDATKKGEEEEE
jgi:hypothetical protein